VDGSCDCRVILKAGLKGVPWFGWAMQTFLFAFIKRGQENREADLDRIGRIVSYLSQRRSRNTLVLFPEGTDLSPSNQEKDRR
jgi:lysocardiolipin and lysophospholipid acyltransferase